MMRIIRPTLLVLFAVFMLASCGKRPRNVDPPPGSQIIFPKKYPPADAPGQHL